MEKNKEQTSYTGPRVGPDGVDKAPGEETSAAPVNFTAETQKGKQQIDADVTDENDRPAEENI